MIILVGWEYRGTLLYRCTICTIRMSLLFSVFVLSRRSSVGMLAQAQDQIVNNHGFALVIGYKEFAAFNQVLQAVQNV